MFQGNGTYMQLIDRTIRNNQDISRGRYKGWTGIGNDYGYGKDERGMFRYTKSPVIKVDTSKMMRPKINPSTGRPD